MMSGSNNSKNDEKRIPLVSLDLGSLLPISNPTGEQVLVNEKIMAVISHPGPAQADMNNPEPPLPISYTQAAALLGLFGGGIGGCYVGGPVLTGSITGATIGGVVGGVAGAMVCALCVGVCVCCYENRMR
jgi:hypothetical protein